MRVHRRDAATLRRGLQSWQAEGLLDPSQAKVLDGAIEIAPFNWKGLARYSFLGKDPFLVLHRCKFFTARNCCQYGHPVFTGYRRCRCR